MAFNVNLTGILTAINASTTQINLISNNTANLGSVDSDLQLLALRLNAMNGLLTTLTSYLAPAAGLSIASALYYINANAGTVAAGMAALDAAAPTIATAATGSAASLVTLAAGMAALDAAAPLIASGFVAIDTAAPLLATAVGAIHTDTMGMAAALAALSDGGAGVVPAIVSLQSHIDGVATVVGGIGADLMTLNASVIGIAPELLTISTGINGINNQTTRVANGLGVVGFQPYLSAIADELLSLNISDISGITAQLVTLNILAQAIEANVPYVQVMGPDGTIIESSFGS